MVFMCQKNSFLKEFKTKVVSCEKAKLETTENGKKVKIEGYDIELEDTILFPEGGGQPCDYGLINEAEVIQVRREGSRAIHFTKTPLQVNEEVTEVVNWDRRFDHMQQHSGQHLLSAILDRDYGYNTDSWWLGEEVCYIEADTPKFTKEDIEKTEKIVNEYIRQNLPVVVHQYNADDPALQNASTRGLPEDISGEIRVIQIGEIDSNMCCGTHVQNLSQLQIIKILHAEKSSRKNKTNIFFLVGNRVIKRLNQCLERETKMTSLLNNAPEKHVELVEKIQKNSKDLNKSVKEMMKELVAYEVNKIKERDPPLKYHIIHRKENDMDFINGLLRNLGDCKTLIFFSCGEDTGMMVLYGEPNDVAVLGPKLCELLVGKGAGKGNRFQGKITNLKNLKKCEEEIKLYFKE